VKIFYTDHFVLPLPEGHRFPMRKYSLLRQRVMQAGLSGGEALREPHAATDKEILRAHDAGYLRRVVRGELTPALAMQAEGRARRIVLLDCDVYHGNGTASILANDPTVFTFSNHGARNFQFRKEASDLDVERADGTGDAEYLDALERGICYALSAAQSELAIYLAGADPYRDDRFGRLALSKESLRTRDSLVLDLCRAACLPVAIVMAGGYARKISDTVDVHFSSVEVAAHFQRAAQQSHALSSPATR
jgi:acetoin utilization deacetylase AcuC-like enzyme